MPRRQGEWDPTFIDSHGRLIRAELRSAKEGLARRARVLGQEPIDRLRYSSGKPLISERQYQAADTIRRLYAIGGFSNVRATNWERGSPGLPKDPVAARKSYLDYMRRLGVVGERVIYWVVIAGYAPTEYGKHYGLHRTDGIGVLRASLDALADLMGL